MSKPKIVRFAVLGDVKVASLDETATILQALNQVQETLEEWNIGVNYSIIDAEEAPVQSE